MTSAENSVSEPSNLKIFMGRIPPEPLYKALAFGTCDYAPTPSPLYKKPSYGPDCTPPNSAQLTNSEPIKPTESGKKGLDCYCLYHVCLSF